MHQTIKNNAGSYLKKKNACVNVNHVEVLDSSFFFHVPQTLFTRTRAHVFRSRDPREKMYESHQELSCVSSALKFARTRWVEKFRAKKTSTAFFHLSFFKRARI